MKQWTTEERYRRLDEVSEQELKELKYKVDKCPHRQQFHIQPPTGLLNDPNGFSYFNGRYHLFYQWFPLGPVHGLKHWYHVSSTDLVNWEEHGVAIKPSHAYDSHGVYSGTGFVHNDKLHLFYTGNVRDEKWQRETYQCLAIMDKNGYMQKVEKPVIDCVPEGYTTHFRDPKIFEKDRIYYCIIGAQRENETGCIVYYKSKDLLNWEFKGELKTGLNEFGFMWECPDYFVLNNYGVIIFCPQGIEKEGDLYENIYQSGYLIGEQIDLDKDTFNHNSFKELDRGFDFYAPQTMMDEKGRRILVGWMGLPEISYPTDKNGWAHCLTIPRKLEIYSNHLYQTPVEELQALRKNQRTVEEIICSEVKSFEGFEGNTYELVCTFSNFTENVGVKLRTSEDEETVILYDVVEKKLVFDRTKSGELSGVEYGSVRKCALDCKKLKLQIFVDISSVEVFVNNGEEVFTGRIFTKKNSQGIQFFSYNTAKLQATIWEY